ncbi:hypothetical protein VNO80_19664 [Phaseolus coccineus]|uniref:SDR family oxidoreductase n=1 Tax=Phaseolus coccineus TaxID=3886 RepID=A0AAN9MGF4_PHACN
MANSAHSMDNAAQKLAGKVVIITGGASGIGEETGRLFASHGARMVVIADIQDELGNQVAASIGSDRGRASERGWGFNGQRLWPIGRHVLQRRNPYSLRPDNPRPRLFPVRPSFRRQCEGHGGVCEARRALDGGAAREGQHRMHSERDGVARHHVAHGLRDVKARGEGASALRECAAGGARYQGELRLTEWVGHTVDACGARDMEIEELQQVYAQSSKGVFLSAKHVADAVLFLASGDSEFVTGHDLVVDGSFAV